MSIFELESTPDGGPEVELDQGWMEYYIDTWLKPRFGVILVPFGRFNIEHFDILNDLASRPMLVEKIVPVSWVEAGAGASGSVLLGDLVQGTGGTTELDYQIYAINGLREDFTDTGTLDARPGLGADNNDNKAFVGRLGLKLAPGQELGVSGYTGNYDRHHRANGVDADWRLTLGNFELVGEYAMFVLERGGYQSDGITTVPTRLAGGYAQVNYHFWLDALNSTFLGQRFESPTMTAVARVGQVDISDDGDPGTGDNRERRLSLGLNYRPTATWAFKLEYQFNDTKNEPVVKGDDDGFIFSVTATF